MYKQGQRVTAEVDVTLEAGKVCGVEELVLVLVVRVRQNGAHRAKRARKVSIFDGKCYLSFMCFFT